MDPLFMCRCDPTYGQSCPICDGTFDEVASIEPLPEPDYEEAA